MATQSKAVTLAFKSISAKSTRHIHTLKNTTGARTTLFQKDYAQNVRTISYDTSKGKQKKSEVDEWSNGLRESLLSNLSSSYIAKSKLATSNGFDVSKKGARFHSPSLRYLYQSHEAENSIGADPARLSEKEILFTTDDIEAKSQKLTEYDDGNYGTKLQKTVDLNMNDLSESKGIEDKNKLSMDINVVVKIKPYEEEKKIGFQQISKRRKSEQSVENQSQDSVRLSSVELPGSMTKTETSLVNNKLEETVDAVSEEVNIALMSEDLLKEELGKVYAHHMQNMNESTLPLENMDNNMEAPLARGIRKVKELYLRSLSSVRSKNECETKSRDESNVSNCLDGTTQNYGTNSGFSLNYNADTQSPIDISNIFGTSRPRTATCRILPNVLSSSMSRRTFSTTSQLSKSKDGKKKDDCDKAKKLPCLQASELSKTKSDVTGHKAVCEKFCMPCCKPARDPPECFYPYHKPPCEKLKPPRPAFSECKTLFSLKQVQPCECLRPRGTTCKKSKESAKCSK